MDRFREGFQVSLAVGGLVGLAYALIGLAIVALRGPTTVERFGLSVPEVLGAYIMGGLVAGAIVGVCHRLARRHPFFAAVVGYVATLPFMFALSIIIEHPAVRFPWLVPLALSLIGAAVGWSVWQEEVGRRS